MGINVYQFIVNHRLDVEKNKLETANIELEVAEHNLNKINTVQAAYQKIANRQDEDYGKIIDMRYKIQLDETDAESISNHIETFLDGERIFRNLAEELKVSIYDQVDIKDFGERISKGPLRDRLRYEIGIIEKDNMRLVTFTKFLGRINTEWIALKFTEDFNLRSTPKDPEPPLEENIIDKIAEGDVVSCSLIGLSEDELWAKVSVTYIKENVEKSNLGWVVIKLIQYPSIGPYS